MPQSVPTVVGPPQPDGARKRTTPEYQAHVRVPITHEDILNEDGSIHADALVRLLTSVQDANANATRASRGEPPSVVIKQVTLLANAVATIHHGLGVTFGGYWVTRTYATYKDAHGVTQTTQAASFRELGATGDPSPPPGIDTRQYLVVLPQQSGCYDIKVVAGGGQ